MVKRGASIVAVLLTGLCYTPTNAHVVSAAGRDFAYTSTSGGRVTRVWDGDTVVITPPWGRSFTCRLYGIDAPETPGKGVPGQPHGAAAAAKLRKLVLGRDVAVKLTGERSYKRQIGIIMLDGVDVNQEMVRRGYAWAYVRYLRRPYVSDYLGAEQKARQARRGLWRDRNPMPPWEFRRMLRKWRR
ncbi:nuclease (SNase domain protein) [Geobacter metallireducens RCH3]|uniref:Nuclease, putative n=1 Tax=Geobacter metallireducens (strain ATCC 53774 / DSM 7210 / GS-15) TaxID=269799 RepID=Q39T22_GEOMG|nr:thermonuclease family protein [Geobacter metallireducens]ABB32602.1 nuclease, putative [Geobacter metallireducens GS-15]EHP83865.1 nuclease (SNase domain protein) [Geobacter metallireducens RCH3]